MKLVHTDAPPQRKPARVAAMALSAFFLCSCAASSLMRPVPAASVSPIPPQSAARPDAAASESFESGRVSLPSTWERGRCVFENGRFISYSDVIGSRSRSLRVDSDARGARSVICSEDFTVIMLPDRAIISLGGKGVLDGAEMLGVISGRFISANSYEVSLKPVIEEDGGFSSPSLSGTALSILSGAGRRWSISLSNPYAGWNVY